ncbi:Atrial natriuretic peptide receptor 1 [Lamellibrachia satsuma]|nr:Atrial natriuretic peptide receptor 1 [Lamellibrachia satsuma]
MSIVVGFGDSGRFRYKAKYPLLTRLAYCQCLMRQVFMSVLTYFHWTDISLITDRSDLHARGLGESLDEGFQIGGIFPNVVSYYSRENFEYADLLKQASSKSRVIFFAVPHGAVRKFLLTAYDLGYINGDYVFLDAALVESRDGEETWYRGDDNDMKAKAAFEALLRLRLSWPSTDVFETFSNQVKKRALESYGYDYGSEKVNFFTGSYHDAVLLFGIALNETFTDGSNLTDGYAFSKRMWDRNFVGVTGDIFMDDIGDRKTTYIITDMNPRTGIFEPVAYYWGSNPGYHPVAGATIHWPGGQTEPPPNTPRCGFENENPICFEKDTRLIIPVVILAVVIVFILVIGSAGAVFGYRRYTLENQLRDMSWMVKIEELQDLPGNRTDRASRQLSNGMCYIHDSDIKFHGNLCSSNCVVDGRFTVRITDFGLPTFYKLLDESSRDLSSNKKLLWRAPELLRQSKHASGTQAGDVYGFSIILQELIVWGEPYDKELVTMQFDDIVTAVRAGSTPPFRPTVPDDACALPLREMMEMCWMEDELHRPDFTTIRRLYRKMHRGKETTIMEKLVNRMEAYATNLENIVAERTQLLVIEQKKTDVLLYQILPRSIAEQLKNGQSVAPEVYDNVTIYFSDIVGFTPLSARLNPMGVVDLLNNLYTAFDGVIESFDVYKVETIGDAYMVVSGLPIRNGNTHAREIARMSLKLLSSIDSFEVPGLPDYKLQLRIGLHSGPCVAGVVGLKMPRYCLFGDTVNMASRMESHGMGISGVNDVVVLFIFNHVAVVSVVDFLVVRCVIERCRRPVPDVVVDSTRKIHISELTKAILEEFETFDLQERGQIEIKGKGLETTYWLVGEIPA